MEYLIQRENSYTQSINKVEVRISQLENIYRNKKALPTQSLTIPNFPSHIDGNQESHGVLETSTKIQFHHTISNLTNPKSWTNWKVFISIKLRLNMNVNPIFNFLIQF